MSCVIGTDYLFIKTSDDWHSFKVLDGIISLVVKGFKWTLKAGFSDIEVLEEKLYMDGYKIEGRQITSLVIRAVKI
jgi:hypothetical protein